MSTHLIDDRPGVSGYEELLDWLRHFIQARLAAHFQREPFRLDGFRQTLPHVLRECPHLADWLAEHELSFAERTVLILALSPHLDPEFLSEAIQSSLDQPGDFPLLGGTKGKNSRAMLPTGQTAAFLLGGSSIEQRMALLDLFADEHPLVRDRVIGLEEVPFGEPLLSGRLVLSPELVNLWLRGVETRPRFGAGFPAELLETALEWEDLVLPQKTFDQLNEILRWVRHHRQLMQDWGMHKRLKPGYRTLFHGPPGTGKTLTATLLGKMTDRPVYRVDLSQVVSKYIGETEKNLASLFDRARNKEWILFFDEADALFGKRTNVKDAHDRYANQEVSYLLQRVEDFPGLVILATNFKNNIDEAFQRRFQTIVHFPFPRTEERWQLWSQGWPAAAGQGPEVDLEQLAQRFELSGANIMNVLQYAALVALDREGTEIRLADLLEGIKREYGKEGKLI